VFVRLLVRCDEMEVPACHNPEYRIWHPVTGKRVYYSSYLAEQTRSTDKGEEDHYMEPPSSNEAEDIRESSEDTSPLQFLLAMTRLMKRILLKSHQYCRECCWYLLS
jgi:predicted Zn-dependent protease